MQIVSLSGGFTDHSKQSATAFRLMLQAMARPGQIYRISGVLPPQPMSVAMAVILLTLCDQDNSVYIAPTFQSETVEQWLIFHTAVSFADPQHANFAIGSWDELAAVDGFAYGNDQYPELSTTLICELPALESVNLRITGPGIATENWLNLKDDASSLRRPELFPRGVDMFLTAGDQISAIPRSAKLEMR